MKKQEKVPIAILEDLCFLANNLLRKGGCKKFTLQYSIRHISALTTTAINVALKVPIIEPYER